MKKTFALTMVLVLIIGLVPMNVFAATGEPAAWHKFGTIQGAQSYSLPGLSINDSLNVVLLEKQSIAFIIPTYWNVSTTQSQQITTVSYGNVSYQMEIFQGTKPDSKFIAVRNSEGYIVFMGPMNTNKSERYAYAIPGVDSMDKTAIDFCMSIQYIANAK